MRCEFARVTLSNQPIVVRCLTAKQKFDDAKHPRRGIKLEAEGRGSERSENREFRECQRSGEAAVGGRNEFSN